MDSAIMQLHPTDPVQTPTDSSIQIMLKWFADNLVTLESKSNKNYSQCSQAKRLLIIWESWKKSLAPDKPAKCSIRIHM